MGSDHIPIVRGDEPQIGPLVREDIEVIEPEVLHHFLELSFAVESAEKLRLGQLHQNGGWPVHPPARGGGWERRPASQAATLP